MVFYCSCVFRGLGLGLGVRGLVFKGWDFRQPIFGHLGFGPANLLAKTNFGQSNLGQSIFGQSVWQSGVCHGGAPKGGNPKGLRAQKGEGPKPRKRVEPKGGGAKISRLFFFSPPLPLQFSLLSSFSWSSRGTLVVFEAPGPSNVHEDPAASGPAEGCLAESKSSGGLVPRREGPGEGGPGEGSLEGGQGLQKRRATPEFVFGGGAAGPGGGGLGWGGPGRLVGLEWHNSGHSKCTSQFSQNCLGQTMSGQTLSGQTSFGQTWFWPKLVWPNLVLTKVGLAKSWPSGLGNRSFGVLGFFRGLEVLGFKGFRRSGFLGFQGFGVLRF